MQTTIALATAPVHSLSTEAAGSAGRLHLRRRGWVTVARPPAEALEFFTPEGERCWAPGWSPEYHYPASGETCTGMVFSTAADGRSTHWIVLDWRPGGFSVRYARVTPGWRAGTVEVDCRAEGDATRAEVTYELTSLSSEGDADLARWTEEWFAGYLMDWERLIAAALAKC